MAIRCTESMKEAVTNASWDHLQYFNQLEAASIKTSLTIIQALTTELFGAVRNSSGYAYEHHICFPAKRQTSRTTVPNKEIYKPLKCITLHPALSYLCGKTSHPSAEPSEDVKQSKKLAHLSYLDFLLNESALGKLLTILPRDEYWLSIGPQISRDHNTRKVNSRSR